MFTEQERGYHLGTEIKRDNYLKGARNIMHIASIRTNMHFYLILKVIDRVY